MVHSHSDHEAIPYHVLDVYSLMWGSVHNKTLSGVHVDVHGLFDLS